MGTEKGVKLDDGKIRLGLVLGGFAKGLKRGRLYRHFWSKQIL